MIFLTFFIIFFYYYVGSIYVVQSAVYSICFSSIMNSHIFSFGPVLPSRLMLQPGTCMTSGIVPVRVG